MLSCFKRFIDDTQGGVLIIFALLTFFLVAVAGAGVDMGRAQIIKHKMHQASDAAALAGAAAGYGITKAERDQIVERYFRLNFPENFMGSDITFADMVVEYKPNANRPESINIQLASTVNTTFMNTVGIEKMDIASETEVAVKDSGPAPADIVMALDVSGSMGLKDAYLAADCNSNFVKAPATDPETRMFSLRKSVNNFINDLLVSGNPSNIYSLGTVLYGRDNSPTGSQTLIERPYNNNLEAMRNYYLNDGGLGVLQHINGDGTRGGLGAQRARVMVNTSSRPYGAKDDRIQAVIFMTDGRNMKYLKGGGPNGWDEVDDPSQDALFANQCAQMKSEGVILYTIAFGKDVVCYPSIAAMLATCASGNTLAEKSKYAFVAITGDELEGAFKSIATSISEIRIVK